MITICAVCKKELKVASATTVDGFSSAHDEEVRYSHGICYECGVKLYGVKMMAAVCARMNVDAAKAGYRK